ncbi:MAG: MFS transporter [Planctomycetota bacterium]
MREDVDIVSPGRVRRNFLVLMAYHVVLRAAWIFKTEGVVMPAFLAAVAGPGWVQGLLPLLNRLSQSLPPVFAADALRDAPRKSRWLMLTTGGMAAGALAWSLLIVLTEDADGSLPAGVFVPAVFLVGYTLFFVATGLNQVVFGTLQGKLIPAERRGALMGRAGLIGSATAVTAAVLFLGRWSGETPGDFVVPFALTAAGMTIAVGLASLTAETPDEPQGPRAGVRLVGPLKDAAAAVRSDRDFAIACGCGALFVAAQLIFPHYVTWAGAVTGGTSESLLLFLVSQNLGAGMTGLAVGRVADRAGNRLALRVVLAGSALAPLAAIGASAVGTTSAFAAAFFLMGLMPVTFRTLTNYVLELVPRASHPRYVGTLRLAFAAPVVFAIPVGAAVDACGHAPVFAVTAAVIASAAVLIGFAREPRGDGADASAGGR